MKESKETFEEYTQTQLNGFREALYSETKTRRKRIFKKIDGPKVMDALKEKLGYIRHPDRVWITTFKYIYAPTTGALRDKLSTFVSSPDTYKFYMYYKINNERTNIFYDIDSDGKLQYGIKIAFSQEDYGLPRW